MVECDIRRNMEYYSLRSLKIIEHSAKTSVSAAGGAGRRSNSPPYNYYRYQYLDVVSGEI